MEKILILGAGIYQVPLIKKAKEIGLYTVVVSIEGNYPGFAFADKIYYVDTRDYGAVLDIAKKEKISGIVTAGTDVAVITIGKVCDELGLTGLSAEAAEIASNKLLMKSRYEKYGVRTARFRKVPFEMSAMKRQTEELCFPMIFKAVDSSGSRGIIRVNTENQYREAMQYVHAATKLDYFIVEEFLEGEEFGAQSFICNGELQFILPHGDYIFQGDTGVPVGHYAPYKLSADVYHDIEVQLKTAAAAMKLDNCAINADFILSDGKVYVLELGGRSGATCLAELTSIYYGFDYYEKILRVCMGEEVSFSSNKNTPGACMLLTAAKEGKIIAQKNNNVALKNIVEVQFDFKPGDTVKKFRVGPDRIGHVITSGLTLEGAVATLQEALKYINIEIE